MLPRDVSVARRILLAYAILTGMAALAIALALPTDNVIASVSRFWWIALASAAAVGSLVVLSDVWTATGAYAAVFWCFHFGLIAVLGAGLVAPSDISIWDQSWVQGPFATDAALLALIASLALASGASLVHARHPAASRRTAVSVGHQAAHPHGVAGSVLVLVAVATWCGIVIVTGGIGGFFVPYVEYLQTTSEFSEVISVTRLALGLGIVMSVTGRSGWLRTSAIAAFGGQALIALPLGLRGEILFASVAAFVASARCGRVLSSRAICGLGLVLLVLIPVVREVRSVGVRDLSETVLNIRPLDAFAEMGASLHPVEKVVRWHAEGEPLEKGRSYWAPVERAARRMLPGIDSVAAEDDQRIMNILVLERVGAIGFSPVAEAYRNFGAAGVVVVFILLGGILGALDCIADPRTAVLALAAVYVPLLINIRNSFISVPAQCAAGILIVVGLGALRHMVGSVMLRSYARTPYVRGAI
jgi:hypothetical protein